VTELNFQNGLNEYSLENCAFLGYYAASSGKSLQTFWNNLWVPSSRGPLKIVRIICLETTIMNYHYSLR